MLLIVTNAALPADDTAWITQAIVRGVKSEAGGAIVINALTDPQLQEASDSAVAAIVAVMSSEADPQVRAACEAAAASCVYVTDSDSDQSASDQFKNDDTPQTLVVLEATAGTTSIDAAAAGTAPPTPTQAHTQTIHIKANQPYRSTWKLRRLGRALASSACEPQRLDRSDHSVRRASAATAAVDALVELLDTEAVEEFQIRGGEAMMVQHVGGKRERKDSPFASDDELIEAIRFMAAYSGGRPQRFDELDPRLDIRVGMHWRLHAEAFVTSPPNVVLRSNMAGRMRLSDLSVACPELEQMLLEAVAGKVRANVVVAASMGGGKTTLCQALLAAVPDHERIDTIEDTPELRLSDYGIHPNAYERLTRDPNQDGHGSHSMAHHIRDAKRSNSDKLVVGEIRGEGCAALLDAMSSGISGCLVTLHSQPGKGVLEKLVAYACAEGAQHDYARRQIATAVDLCVWMGRNEHGQRVVGDVTQLIGIDEQSGVIKTKCLWSLQPGQRWASRVSEPEGRLQQIGHTAPSDSNLAPSIPAPTSPALAKTSR